MFKTIYRQTYFLLKEINSPFRIFKHNPPLLQNANSVLTGFGSLWSLVNPAHLAHIQSGFYPLPQVLKIVVQFCNLHSTERLQIKGPCVDLAFEVLNYTSGSILCSCLLKFTSFVIT